MKRDKTQDKNGFGSMNEIRPGVYRVRIYAGKDHQGREILRSRTFRASSAKEALKKKADAVSDMRRELDGEAQIKGTVGGLVADWLAHQEQLGASPATLYRLQSITREITTHLGRMPLGKVGARDVDRFYGKLRTENIARKTKPPKPANPPKFRSESTIHHYHRVLASILRQGERWEMVDKVATRNATTPRRVQAETSAPDTAVLLEVIADASDDLRFAAVFASRSGLRRGELMGVRLSDLRGDQLHISRAVVDVPGKAVQTKSTKSRRVRDIPLDPVTIDAIHDHVSDLRDRCARFGTKLIDDPYLLADIDASPHDGSVARKPGWATKAWERQCARHGVHIRLHDLRHWHLSYLLANGIPLKEVQDRGGHSLGSTTLNIYGHVIDGNNTRAAALMGALPAGKPDVPSTTPTAGEGERA